MLLSLLLLVISPHEAGALASACVSPPAPTIHTFQPGASIADLLPRIQPGDEVVLAPGLHTALDLSKLAGTWDRPVVVRGTSTTSPAMITAEGGAFAIRLDGAANIVLRDLALRGGSVAALLADTAPCTNVRIERLAVLRTDGATSDGVRLVGADRVWIERSHLEHAGVPDGAAVRLRDCGRVRIVDVRVVGATPSQAVAFAAEGGTKDLVIDRCRVEGGARIGVLLAGAPPIEAPIAQPAPAPGRPAGEAATQPAAPPAARDVWQVVVSRCVFLRCAAAWSISAANDVVIDRCTVSEPDGGLMVFGAGAGACSPIVLRRNILHWLPNQTTRLADVAPDLRPGAIGLEENLWWSADLTLARRLRRPPGRRARAAGTRRRSAIRRAGEAPRPRRRAVRGMG